MAWVTKNNLTKTLVILKTIVMVLVLKIGLGVLDTGSDMINGFNLLSGQSKLSFYFASQTREEYDKLPDPKNWGYLTICLLWFAGLVRIIFLALDVQWRCLKFTEVLRRIGGYFLLLIAWPLFTPLM